MSTTPTVSNRRRGPGALLARGVAGALRAYHRYYAPLRPPACRFTPSCSEYAATAFERFGLVRGSWLTVRRLSRCHPYHRGGHDPVPDKVDSNRAAHRTDDVPQTSENPTTPTASIAARGATTSTPAGAPRCHTC